MMSVVCQVRHIPIRVVFHQSCLLSLVLLKNFMDRVSRCNQAVEGVKFVCLRILSLLFAGDVVLSALLNSDLSLG